MLGHLGPILSHFEEFGRVWERTGVAKACGAVKMGVRERPKPSARSKKNPSARSRWGQSCSQWLDQQPLKGRHAVPGGVHLEIENDPDGGPLRAGEGVLIDWNIFFADFIYEK